MSSCVSSYMPSSMSWLLSSLMNALLRPDLKRQCISLERTICQTARTLWVELGRILESVKTPMYKDHSELPTHILGELLFITPSLNGREKNIEPAIIAYGSEVVVNHTDNYASFSECVRYFKTISTADLYIYSSPLNTEDNGDENNNYGEKEDNDDQFLKNMKNYKCNQISLHLLTGIKIYLGTLIDIQEIYIPKFLKFGVLHERSNAWRYQVREYENIMANREELTSKTVVWWIDFVWSKMECNIKDLNKEMKKLKHSLGMTDKYG
ncbi:hypothetical protein Glove_372g87 [Diversispora epigaea]|uniref:Uncharacterized protein n=1 Tax=Diversispora epigaea TaxID=1348612 RepID=A0A397H9S2_9GLOM|nr:hypothetical protein Glove_372g87 [Diversispora epigaea]